MPAMCLLLAIRSGKCWGLDCSTPDLSASPWDLGAWSWADGTSCRVGKERPAGSNELRVSPSPSKIPYGGFSPVRLQMDRQWRPSTTSQGLSAVHIRPMMASYTPPQFLL